MNVLIISQCDKRALTETRRILDQFAERRGDRTWQTAITQDGLDTLRRLLRKTARKNTAVACHWIRGLDHSELLWRVGDRSRFSDQGAVPTHTTARNVLRGADENDWYTGEDIRLLAQLAGLLHDLGKATVAFQERLRGQRHERNLIRHEWASLRFFQAFVGPGDDVDWLTRLADATEADESRWQSGLCRDGLDTLSIEDQRPLSRLPPLAAAVGWLVVSHHRLPTPPRDKSAPFSPVWLEKPLEQVDHRWNEARSAAECADDCRPYWTVQGPLPVAEASWRKEAARVARKLLVLRERRAEGWLDNPYVMHLARLSLMLVDHHYSGLAADSPWRVAGDGRTRLYANTDAQGVLKQALDEHLLGVAQGASRIAHALPSFASELPALAQHRGLRQRSGPGRFAWQDKATDAAVSMRAVARQHGAFIINMASTGCGKTLANARMLYALADPQRGLRAAYALGLRTLTVQTGRSYRNDLHLGDEDLAILVGGSASRTLFEYYEAQSEATGSASSQELIEEDSHIVFEGDVRRHPLLSRALADTDIQRLLLAPLLVCTVDHLVPATESLRAGRQIAPMLRLLSGDLVLDELDDYDLADLPALTRLVHWAGLLGTRIILSSATLPPALVEGMFAAYRAGRSQYRRNRGAQADASTAPELPCLWVDEFGLLRADCAHAVDFAGQHAQFMAQRAAKLTQAPPLRRAELLPLQISARDTRDIAREFAQPLREACLRLHASHAEVDPVSGKRVSWGLVRMAHVDDIFNSA
ncbi:type I-F CRISPR-associated helicase Cas3f [Amphibiibacter pelophylacis]|uniref:Type I-F CRISPR-associated helicase Cas3f n=1 Tax=Amphibiibacter pelophylacis TaxID=1799477 RepID=A0ACC6P296_9BURK